MLYLLEEASFGRLLAAVAGNYLSRFSYAGDTLPAHHEHGASIFLPVLQFVHSIFPHLVHTTPLYRVGRVPPKVNAPRDISSFSRLFAQREQIGFFMVDRPLVCKVEGNLRTMFLW
jgi:hypothetical protein